MDRFIRGKTHCGNIGDFFRNPTLINFIKRWHRLKNPEDIQALKIYIQKKNKKFSPEFYEFIRSIFENRSEMNALLDYIRESLLIQPEFIESLKGQYETDDFVKILLAFDELNDQLSTITKLPVGDVFSTKIADIIGAANTQASHFQDEDEVDVDYSLSQLKGLRQTIKAGVMPISSDGEILLYIDEDNGKYIMSTLSTGDIIHTDKNGNRLDKNNELIEMKVEKLLNSRQKVLKELQTFNLAFEYHIGKIKTEELPQEAEDFYSSLAIDFAEKKNITIETLFKNQMHLTNFKKWMIIEYKNLEQIFLNMPASDTTKTDEWKKQGVTPKIHSDLPDYDLGQKFPKKKGVPKLTVVKN